MPADGGVLTVGDAAVFDLRPPVLYNTCFDDCIFEQLVKGKTPGEIRAELAARHIAYVYVNWGEIDRYRSPGNYGFTDFVQPAVFARLVQRGRARAAAADQGPSGPGISGQWSSGSGKLPAESARIGRSDGLRSLLRHQTWLVKY